MREEQLLRQYRSLQNFLFGATIGILFLAALFLYCLAFSRGPSDAQLEEWREIQECVKDAEPLARGTLDQYQTILRICEEATNQ